MLHFHRRRTVRAHDDVQRAHPMKMPPLSFELKLLEHRPLSDYKYAVLYRIGSVAMLSAQITRPRRGRGWCICNVILTSPQVTAGWSLAMQAGWERGIAAALRIDPERYSLVFHWHRTNLLITEGTRETLEALLHEQCASTVQ
jgi:hypothetical protein